MLSRSTLFYLPPHDLCHYVWWLYKCTWCFLVLAQTRKLCVWIWILLNQRWFWLFGCGLSPFKLAERNGNDDDGRRNGVESNAICIYRIISIQWPHKNTHTPALPIKQNIQHTVYGDNPTTHAKREHPATWHDAVCYLLRSLLPPSQPVSIRTNSRVFVEKRTFARSAHTIESNTNNVTRFPRIVCKVPIRFQRMLFRQSLSQNK